MTPRNLMLALFASGLLYISCENHQDNAQAQSGDEKPVIETAAAAGSDITESVDGNNWYYDWNEAVAVAQKEHKPLYIHFTADWCKWCRKMEAETYSDDTIKERFNNDWVLLKVDTEANGKSGMVYLNEEARKLSLFPGGEGFTEQSLPYPQLLRIFGGQGIPALSFIDVEGTLIYTHPGYLTTQQFGPMLDYFHGQLYTQDIQLGDYIESNS